MAMNVAMGLLVGVAIIAISLLNLCQGYKFYVGGRDGWVAKPSEGYNHWAERNRFQVNDTLVFKYKRGDESVLVVTRDNYMNCYTDRPLQNLTDGDTEFKFSRSGPHYFIPGNEDHCKQGQRLIVVVLAVRPPRPSPAQLAPPPEVAPLLVPPPELAAAPGVSHLGPAVAPKSSPAVRSGGGSLGLMVALCLLYYLW